MSSGRVRSCTYAAFTPTLDPAHQPSSPDGQRRDSQRHLVCGQAGNVTRSSRGMHPNLVTEHMGTPRLVAKHEIQGKVCGVMGRSREKGRNDPFLVDLAALLCDDHGE